MSNREFQASHSHQIFVVGRSGTTMMGRILGRHSMVFTFHELHFFEYLWNPDDVPPVLSIDQASLLAARLLTIQRDGYFTQADPQQYLEEAQAVIEGSRESLTPPAVFGLFLDYETRRYGKSISCDQTPRNLFYLREVLDLYPNAYVVNMIRDPRGVLLSQKNRFVPVFVPSYLRRRG